MLLPAEKKNDSRRGEISLTCGSWKKEAKLIDAEARLVVTRSGGGRNGWRGSKDRSFQL